MQEHLSLEFSFRPLIVHAAVGDLLVLPLSSFPAGDLLGRRGGGLLGDGGGGLGGDGLVAALLLGHGLLDLAGLGGPGGLGASGRHGFFRRCWCLYSFRIYLFPSLFSLFLPWDFCYTVVFLLRAEVTLIELNLTALLRFSLNVFCVHFLAQCDVFCVGLILPLGSVHE